MRLPLLDLGTPCRATSCNVNGGFLMSIEPSSGAVNPGKTPTVWVVGGVLGLVSLATAATIVLRPHEASTAQGGESAPASAATATTADAARQAAKQTTPTSSPRPAAARPNKPTGAEAPATREVAVCGHCGVVESVVAVKRKGEGTGLGAVAGGVLGAVVGHQVGGGNGKKAATVLGAVGGGVAGHEVEKRARAETVYQVRIRMDDQSLRNVEQAQAPRVGSRVEIHGRALKTLAPQG